MTVKDHIIAGLNEMKQSGEINEYVHELLLTRVDSMTAIISGCGSIAEAINAELYGLDMEPSYTAYGEVMTPVSREEALKLFDSDTPIYLIYPDNTEGLCEDRGEIENGDFHFAAEHNEPQSLLQSQIM
ncbi:MAG: hypothetical protein GX096_16025 [Clostridiales bacterium]|nr:hypothetical protein [Clostridiales bacterium]